ncbi:MAG: hypothetical protein JXJ18_11200 [Rhodobacteraceae bacterium]|nr:hypothetical protein [Paracoccaceae bacterium]
MRISWLLRMSRWARNPPSEGRVKLVLGIVVLCLLLALFERLFGWPAWLTVNSSPNGRIGF